MDPLSKAISTLGTASSFAAALGVSSSTPHMWIARGKVPAEHCPVIERETRRVAAEKGDPALIVTCEELRPDVAWGVLREQVAGETPEPTQPPGPDRRQPSDHCMQSSTSGRDVAAALAGVDAKPQEA